MKNKTKLIIIIVSITLIATAIFIFALFKFERISCEIVEISNDKIYGRVPYPIKSYFDIESILITDLNGKRMQINELKVGDTVHIVESSKKYECKILQINNDEIEVEILRSMYYCFSSENALILNENWKEINPNELKVGDYISIINIKESFDDLLVGYYDDKKDPPDPLEDLHNVIFVKVKNN